ncbi:alpha/beta-hydrolase [Gigaspora margarita]|uniref:Alpha/beta-hydrolase n=1 Tax=Gigaspora margarita TaxID=4874 RepID=A0A8H4AKJ6_GIGMA|nr:alpha/beta-hydrolase [Gigaspora margarita]
MSTIILRYLVQGLQRETHNIEDSLLVLHADDDIDMLKESICKKHDLLKKSSSVEKIFNHECEKLSDISKPINSIFEFLLKEKNIHIIVSFEELMWMKINDVEVYTKTWKAKNEPKAYITFLHSYVDHIGFYDHIFSKFKDNNIKVNAFDQCGHGRTWKKNANPSVGKGWDIAIEDIKKFVEKQDRKDAPHFLIGHGVEGALAFYATMDKAIESISGCIALSPLLKPFEQGIDVPEILIRARKLVNRVFPNFTIKLELDSEKLTS